MLSTVSAVSVPKLVTLDCAAVVRVPPKFVAVTFPFTVTLSSNAIVPVDDAI